MTFFSTVKSGARLAAVTPALWAYGLLSAGLGAAVLISGLLAAFGREDKPVGHGFAGWLALGAVMAVSLAAEAAACRAAARGGGLAAALTDSVRLLPRGASLVIALLGLAVAFCLFVAVPVLAVMRTFLAVILMMVFPFIVDATMIIGSFIAALALLVPAWMLLPLAVRGVAVHRRNVAESLTDAMTVIEDRTGAVALFGLICIGLDAALLIGAWRLGARDLSLIGRFHVLAAWHGTRLAAGVLVLAIIGAVAAFKAGVWTALYLDVAGRENWADSTAPRHERLGDLRLFAALSRRAALHTRGPAPFILAAIIVLIGAFAPVDLLPIYHLVPSPADDPSRQIMHQIPGGGRTLVLLFVPAWLMSIYVSACLAAATDQLARQQPARLGAALRIGLSRFFNVIWALILLGAAAVLIGGTVLVAVLFGMALLVQFAKGLNQLADQFGNLIGVAVIAAPVILSPLVIRAVVIEKLSPGDAVGRGFDLALARPLAALLTFLLTIALEVLRGPVAKWAGLITSGWAEIFAVSGSLHPPLPRAELAHSALVLLLGIVLVAFEAQLWTELYRDVSAHQPHQTPQKRRRHAVQVGS